MGNTYEVSGWVNKGDVAYEHYRWEVFWTGENFEDALNAMTAAKNEGCGRIRLEWRP